MSDWKRSNGAGHGNARGSLARVVVLAEDEGLIRLVLAEVLRDRGLEVLEAVDATEALTFLERAHPVDLVITDVRMPGPMSGLDLAALARTRWPAIKVVVTSGHLAHVPPMAHAYFAKPYDLDKVASAVVALLEDQGDERGPARRR